MSSVFHNVRLYLIQTSNRKNGVAHTLHILMSPLNILPPSRCWPLNECGVYLFAGITYRISMDYVVYTLLSMKRCQNVIYIRILIG